MSVAIVGPAFFGYLGRIAGLMTERGIPTRFYDEFPSNRIFAKIALRYSSLTLRQRATRRYHAAITDQILRSGATHILFGTVEMFPHECIRRLAEHGIIMCRYAWDSIANKPYAKTLDPFLHAIASFDPNDCQREGYKYVPLYSAVPSPVGSNQKNIDFLYCATFHSNRPKILSKIIGACLASNWKLKLMLFFHSRKLWYLRFMLRPRLWNLGRLLTTKPFSLDEIAQMTARSRVVVDIHHSGQTGLTMRTFEALSLGAVVLTTNAMASAELPGPLRDRVVVLNVDDVMRSMEQALSRQGGTLSAEMCYHLSVDRFLDQIIALLLGVEDIAESRDVPTLAGCESEI